MARILYPGGYLLIIDRYLRERGGSRCFSYRGLRSWLFKQPELRDVEWHTMERAIRRLAEDGFLRRVERGKKVFFCVSEKGEEAIDYLRSRFGGSRR